MSGADARLSVLISINDSHTTDGEVQSFEMMTKGLLTVNENGVTLEYEESYDEFSGCHTVLSVTSGKYASIIRSGGYSTELILETGKHHSCGYDTPFGSMLIGIGARRIYCDVNENGGTIELKYTVDLYGDVACENELCITVERIEEK